MIALLGRLRNQFRDSPTYGRDRASLFSGGNFGIIGLLLNAMVLLPMMLLMLEMNDREIRMFLGALEFGQLLSLILAGGTAGLITLLVPLRMTTLFMGPRTGRYFDQIVLSGISPFRFLIGKVTSQNLFLGICLFMMIPYVVLSLTVGGIDLLTFLACIILLWVYSIMLSLATLWTCLYMNEVLAAMFVIAGAAILGGFGAVPFGFNPIAVTPFPALVQSLYTSLPPNFFGITQPKGFWVHFVSCLTGMSLISLLALLALWVGPLYGIIKENSTFGEVVRPGDSRRKRLFRLRPHIQRPSEIAFFYQNRSDRLGRIEGLWRWGGSLTGLTALLCFAYACMSAIFLIPLGMAGGRGAIDWIGGFHIMNFVIYSVSLVLAGFIFCHPLNTTFLQLPVFGRVRASTAFLDTFCFILFAAISTGLLELVPRAFDLMFAIPTGISVMYPGGAERSSMSSVGFYPVEFMARLTPIILISALTIYALLRALCLQVWVKSMATVGVIGLYGMGLCAGPVIIMEAILEFQHLQFFRDMRPMMTDIATASPVMCGAVMFGEDHRIPPETPFGSFYIVHTFVILLALVSIYLSSRKVRKLYLADPPEVKS